jgi:ComF family protein
MQCTSRAADMSYVPLDLLFPPLCLGCQALLRQRADPPACGRCAAELVALPASDRTCEGATAMFAYEGPMQRALARLKYQGSLAWAGPLGALLSRAPELCSSPTSGARWDALVPVPLHWRRLLARGFNQSLLLTRVAMRSVPPGERPTIRAGWLRRMRATPPQAELDATARRQNLLDAFAVPCPRRVQGRRVLVVDDVTTTGATLGAAVVALRRAGATEVGALALMRTLFPT